MEQKGKRIILASASPRRRELLAGLDVEFEVDTRNNFEETIDPSIPHERIPEVMSIGKSHGFHRELLSDEILLTSDTMVLCEGEVLGKPHGREDAVRMLKLLSGRTHKVVTAVTLRNFRREATRSDFALVRFKELTDHEIEYYIDRYSPYDKAGAYGIQEWIGYAGITGIEGSFYTIMGLPVHIVYEMLKEFID